MYSWDYDILSTLLRHKVGSLQDTIKIQLGSAVLLPLRRPLGHQVRGVHLRPMHLDSGEGDARAFDADRTLDGIKLRAGIDQPLHEPEVATGQELDRTLPDY